MPDTESRVRARTLYEHFFRRFFDNDTLAIAGETQTSVVRALCIVAVPGLMVAFWLLPFYVLRSPIAIAGDRYFYVLYSFVAMGAAATFEWEMLYPDRADFLILLPLPLKPRELFYAKGRALLTFLALFLVAANIFGAIFFSAGSTPHNSNYFHTVAAHAIAVGLAGLFATFTMLAIRGISLTLLSDHLHRLLSPILQCLAVAALLLLFVLLPACVSRIQIILEGRAAFANWIPPLWFLGLYEHLVLGKAAPAGAWHLATLALYATVSSALLAVITYPAAWARQRRRAMEGTTRARKQSSTWIAALLHKTVFPRPQQRAVFHFIAQTIGRNTRYQVYMAVYTGVGLAIALGCVLTPKSHPDGSLSLALSDTGLHLVLPLLLFWMIAGLRSAFAFPVDMAARWVFPISLATSPSHNDAKAAKNWTLLCCAVLSAALLALLLALHWSWWALAIQLVWSIALSVILTDLSFIGPTRIPFTQARMPGRTNLPLILVVYAALFPGLTLFAMEIEILAELRPVILLGTILTTIALHLLCRATDHLAQRGIIGDFPEDETDNGPTTLGLVPSTER